MAKRILCFFIVFSMIFSPAIARGVQASPVTATDPAADEDAQILGILGWVLVGSLVVALIAVVATAIDDADREAKTREANVWPVPASKWITVEPQKVKSTEEAVADIKNVQPRMMVDGIIPSLIDTDKYGMRIKIEWYETTTGEQYSYSNGGYFLGWNYIPTFSTTTQEVTTTVPKNKTVAVTFKEVTGFAVYENNQVFIMTPYESIRVQCRDAGAVKLLVNAVYTLAAEAGNKIDNRNFGFAYQPLTDEQKKRTGLGDGVYISNVCGGGVAEKAGLKLHDIVAELNGAKITSAAEMGDAVNKLGSSGKIEMKVMSKEKALLKDYTTKTVKFSR